MMYFLFVRILRLGPSRRIQTSMLPVTSLLGYQPPSVSGQIAWVFPQTQFVTWLTGVASSSFKPIALPQPGVADVLGNIWTPSRSLRMK